MQTRLCWNSGGVLKGFIFVNWNATILNQSITGKYRKGLCRLSSVFACVVVWQLCIIPVISYVITFRPRRFVNVLCVVFIYGFRVFLFITYFTRNGYLESNYDAREVTHWQEHWLTETSAAAWQHAVAYSELQTLSAPHRTKHLRKNSENWYLTEDA